MKALGGNVSSPAVPKYAAAPEKIWTSIEECKQNLENANVKIGFLFGTEDPLYNDFYENNMEIFKVVKDCRFTILQGERHLMELDCPDHVANEIFINIEESKKHTK